MKVEVIVDRGIFAGDRLTRWSASSSASDGSAAAYQRHRLRLTFIGGYAVEPVFAAFDGVAEKFRSPSSYLPDQRSPLHGPTAGKTLSRALAIGRNAVLKRRSEGPPVV